MVAQSITRTLPLTAMAALMALSVMSFPAGVLAADDRGDASPWAIASGAEWSGDYPRFNPMLAEAGVKWLRLFPEWQGIQSAPDQWNWDGADKMVADARKNNMHIAGLFAYLARFASADGGTRRFPIKDINYFRDYAAACMNRYKGDIKYWEVWNEFNGSFGPGGTPAIYAELTRTAYDEAKKIDANIKIGMSVANFDVGFLDRAIKAGAADHFDFIAVHPYENLGAAMDGGEVGFLSLTGSLRKMLQANNQPTDMPLWITEIGYQAPVQPDAAGDAKQAEAILKAYLLSIAQGFDKIFWFEARGPAYGHNTDHGILRADWSKRPSYLALKTMATLLGAEPKYIGWLNIGEGGYGFVYQGADGPVLATWATAGKTFEGKFGSDITAIDAAGQRTPLPAGQTLKLDRMPVFVTGLAADAVELAKANRPQPYPWGGDYANATTVTCKLGVTNMEDGLKQVKPETTVPVNDLTSSSRRTDFAFGGEGHYVYFRVDPQFVPYGTNALEITIVAKRVDPGKSAGMILCYESLANGYRGAPGYWTIPAADGWQEYTWELTDANFVGQWGWNFRFDAISSPNEFLVKEVRVTRTGPKE